MQFSLASTAHTFAIIANTTSTIATLMSLMLIIYAAFFARVVKPAV